MITLSMIDHVARWRVIASCGRDVDVVLDCRMDGGKECKVRQILSYLY